MYPPQTQWATPELQPAVQASVAVGIQPVDIRMSVLDTVVVHNELPYTVPAVDIVLYNFPYHHDPLYKTPLTSRPVPAQSPQSNSQRRLQA